MNRATMIRIFRTLGPSVRSGTATPEENALFDSAQAYADQCSKEAQQARVIRSIWDLPITAEMWQGDGRDIER